MADERRRLERDLHDGVQNELVALIVKLALAQQDAETPPALVEMLAGLEARAQAALDSVRNIARGIYPPLLADFGLAKALRAQAARAPVDVSLMGPRLAAPKQPRRRSTSPAQRRSRTSRNTPAAAAQVTLRLRYDQGSLDVRIADDGRGFDPSLTPEGAGMRNIRDRVADLGGTFKVASSPGRGTVLTISLPLAGGSRWTAMSQVILLSLTASLNPTLVAATTVMLLLDKPARLMLGYLLGAYMTSITLGLVIVFSLSNSSTTNTTENTISPAVDIALGAIALAVAFVLYTGRHERLTERRRARKAAKPDKGPPRWQRELSKGSARTTFVVGALLTLPGASYLAGLASDPQAEVLDDRDRADRDRLQPGDAVAARGSARQLPDRSRVDTARDRSRQAVGQPTRPRVRGARIRRGRRATDHQRHHRAGRLTPCKPPSGHGLERGRGPE